MPKYDQKSLTDAADAILSAVDDTEPRTTPAGGSQYGSWQASTTYPPHEQMSLFVKQSDKDYPGESRFQTLDDFAPKSYEVFLTKDFFATYEKVYEAAVAAVSATVKQARYGGTGLYRMADNMAEVEDANLTEVLGVLNKTQNRG
jgi:hypothetical protein